MQQQMSLQQAYIVVSKPNSFSESILSDAQSILREHHGCPDTIMSKIQVSRASLCVINDNQGGNNE